MKLRILLGLSLLWTGLSAQANLKFVVSSYNVENLFDNIHTPGKDDYEFLPNGKAHWTNERLNLKLERVAAEIRAIGNGRGPDIITMPEVKNMNVLMMLNHKLQDLKYIPVITNGPDVRGINVAMLTRFPLARQPIMVPVPIPGDRPTRPVYDVVLQITPTVKFGILMNHWPARMAPEPFRCDAGEVLRKTFINHLMKNQDLDYIATGDFNDEPEDQSIMKCLGLGSIKQVIASEAPHSLFFDLYHERNLPRNIRGTYYFDKTQQWNALDHIILARGLFDNKDVRYVPGTFITIRTPGVNVYNKPVTLPTGEVVPAGAPVSYTTHGHDGSLQAIGVSDHLPVRAEFEVVQ